MLIYYISKYNGIVSRQVTRYLNLRKHGILVINRTGFIFGHYLLQSIGVGSSTTATTTTTTSTARARAVEYESLLSKVKGSLHLDMIEGKVPFQEEELRWHFFKLSQVTDTHSFLLPSSMCPSGSSFRCALHLLRYKVELQCTHRSKPTQSEHFTEFCHTPDMSCKKQGKMVTSCIFS